MHLDELDERFDELDEPAEELDELDEPDDEFDELAMTSLARSCWSISRQTRAGRKTHWHRNEA
jgi:hypothetical protein